MNPRNNPIGSDPRVRQALRELGWRSSLEPEAWLRSFTRRRVATWLNEAERDGLKVTHLDDVRRVVANRLRVRLVEIETDEDLNREVSHYCKRGELAFKSIETEFAGEVEAAILRLRAARVGECPLVAVVDARGARAAARYFGGCHEIGHPFIEPQMKFMFRCRDGATDPIERAVDIVAGEIAFHEPLAAPLVKARAGQDLSFLAVERFHKHDAPFASCTAAFSAAVRLWHRPAMLLIAEERAAKHGRDAGTASLRVATSIPNAAARTERLYVPPFRVPTASVVHQAFYNGGAVLEAREDLSWWRSSDGTVLPMRAVQVGARRLGRSVFSVLRF